MPGLPPRQSNLPAQPALGRRQSIHASHLIDQVLPKTRTSPVDEGGLASFDERMLRVQDGALSQSDDPHLEQLRGDQSGRQMEHPLADLLSEPGIVAHPQGGLFRSSGHQKILGMHFRRQTPRWRGGFQGPTAVSLVFTSGARIEPITQP